MFPPIDRLNPEQRAAATFEGDQLLSIIISKAALLAADDKITDPAITCQLAAR